jgi:hypothetical protein
LHVAKEGIGKRYVVMVYSSLMQQDCPNPASRSSRRVGCERCGSRDHRDNVCPSFHVSLIASRAPHYGASTSIAPPRPATTPSARSLCCNHGKKKRRAVSRARSGATTAPVRAIWATTVLIAAAHSRGSWSLRPFRVRWQEGVRSATNRLTMVFFPEAGAIRGGQTTTMENYLIWRPRLGDWGRGGRGGRRRRGDLRSRREVWMRGIGLIKP